MFDGLHNCSDDAPSALVLPPLGFPPSALASTPEGVRSAALAYAAAGLTVFPLYGVRDGPDESRCACGNADCGSVGKHPRAAHSVLDASADVRRIGPWFARSAGGDAVNLGLATGSVSGCW